MKNIVDKDNLNKQSVDDMKLDTFGIVGKKYRTKITKEMLDWIHNKYDGSLEPIQAKTIQ